MTNQLICVHMESRRPDISGVLADPRARWFQCLGQNSLPLLQQGFLDLPCNLMQFADVTHLDQIIIFRKGEGCISELRMSFGLPELQQQIPLLVGKAAGDCFVVLINLVALFKRVALQRKMMHIFPHFWPGARIMVQRTQVNFLGMIYDIMCGSRFTSLCSSLFLYYMWFACPETGLSWKLA